MEEQKQFNKERAMEEKARIDYILHNKSSENINKANISKQKVWKELPACNCLDCREARSSNVQKTNSEEEDE